MIPTELWSSLTQRRISSKRLHKLAPTLYQTLFINCLQSSSNPYHITKGRGVWLGAGGKPVGGLRCLMFVNQGLSIRGPSLLHNPRQCSCLENPRDGGAWWAGVSGVAQSRTRLKWRSSSSSSLLLHILCCRIQIKPFEFQKFPTIPDFQTSITV